MICLQGSGPSPSPSDFATLEDELGMPLPPSYRAFLERNNGGMPPAEHCLWSDPDRDLSAYIQYFFPLTGSEHNLLNERAEFPVELEPHLIPICLEGGGSYLLLDLQTGAVLLWDADWGDIHPMAESVDDLLEACTAD